MGVGITSNIFRPSVRMVDAGVGSNHNPHIIYPTHMTGQHLPHTYMPLRSASNSPVKDIGYIMLVVQLGNLYVRVHSDSVHSFVVMFLVGTSFTNRFIKRIFLMEHCIIPIGFQRI